MHRRPLQVRFLHGLLPNPQIRLLELPTPLLSLRSHPSRHLKLLALVAALLGCLALPAVASATRYTVKWGRAVPLLNPNDGGGFDAVGCAPATATSTSLLCVAGDVRGDIFASEHPAQARSMWHRRHIDARVAITGIACPSTQLCVAIDADGQVMYTTQPLAGAQAWSKPASIDTATQAGGGYAGLAAISCPTTTFCIAVDNSANGQVAYTTNPTGPASAWTLTTIGSNVTLDAVSCVSATFCMIGGSSHYYATDPTGGASAWKSTGSLSASYSVIASLACKTMKLCVGVGYGNAGVGLVAASSQPSTTTWLNSLIGTDPPSPEAQVVDSVACPQRNFCVAVDGASHAYTTSTPVRGSWSIGKPLKKASQGTVSQVACNAKICVEVDNRGTVIYGAVRAATSTTPTTSTKTTGTSTTGTTSS